MHRTGMVISSYRERRWRHAVSRALLCGALLVPGMAVRAQDAAPAAGKRVAVMAPGDGVRMRVFREPEFTGEFLVDDRGMLVLPKIGELRVGGTPADSIRGVILAELRKILTSTAIEVIPFRRIAITGSVLRPGLYPVDASLTVADALILAGGAAPDAKPRRVEIRLAGAGSGTPISMEVKVWETAAGGTMQLHVPRRAWLRRNGAQFLLWGPALIGSIITLANLFR